jgi:hypothetical protein
VLLIWAWRNRLLYGVTPPRPALQRALRYLMRRAHNGYLMMPAGAGGTWWDASRFPTAGTLSYSQGLYAVALRCALLLGLGATARRRERGACLPCTVRPADWATCLSARS